MSLNVPYGLVGSTGRMGGEIVAACGSAPVLRVWDKGEECDTAPRVIFDFSSYMVLPHTIELCRKHRAALVMGTTALKDDHIAQLKALGEKTRLAVPHATGEIDALVRIERMVAMRAVARIVADPLAATGTLGPSVGRSAAALGAEARALGNLATAVRADIIEKSHGVPPCL